MPITYDETVQTVLDLLQRALKAEALAVERQKRITELEANQRKPRKVKPAI